MGSPKNIRDLIDNYLKENCTENTYAMYSATLLDPNVKRIQILRKLFKLPAAKKAIADLSSEDLHQLEQALTDHIKKGGNDELSIHYARDIRSHIRIYMHFLDDNFPSNATMKNKKIDADVLAIGKEMTKKKRFYITGDIDEVFYVFDAEKVKVKRITFVPSQESSIILSPDCKKAVFAPLGDETDAKCIPFDRNLSIEIYEDDGLIDKFPNPGTLVFEEDRVGFCGHVCIHYSGDKTLNNFDLVEVGVKH